MIHDPMCDDHHDDCPFCNGDCPWCDFAARVRADERGRAYGWPEYQSQRDRDVRAAALRDAVEAVKARCSSDWEFMCIECEESVAAIEALGGDRDRHRGAPGQDEGEGHPRAGDLRDVLQGQRRLRADRLMAAPSNEELAGRILVRALQMTWSEYDALRDAWFAMSPDERRSALVGGAAYDGALVGAFSLAAGSVSSFAYTYFGAALAVLARDSRSESGPFTPAHYEILTRPWRQVIGAVHPDDDLPTGEAAAVSSEALDD